jgi:tetratricopeptide (TPR) repeat protein
LLINLPRLISAALLSSSIFATYASAETSASSYLVARHADRQNDFEMAAEFYLDSLFFDPNNSILSGGAVEALIALGDFEKAGEIAVGMIETGSTNTAAFLAVLGDAARNEDYQKIIKVLARDGVATNDLTDSLVLGWALLGVGDQGRALEAFNMVVNDERYRAFGLYHLGLALAWSGDLEGAISVFQDEAHRNFQSPRSILAEAQILAELDRLAEAERRLLEAFGANSAARELADKIRSGEDISFDFVSTPAEGMAEIYYTLADALGGDAPNLFNLYYARMALEIRPTDSDVLLLVAGLFEQLDRMSIARDIYLEVGDQDAAFFTAAMGVAETLRAEGRLGDAVAHLQGVIADVGIGPYVLVTLGDISRQLDDYESAVDAYTRRLDGGITNGYQDWYVHYVRGVAYERLGQWRKADDDFRRSLAIQPAQPQVLNYLGYSLVERRENLDEALGMIEEAVALRPDSGYIVDSLGWVYYRLGRFEEAVIPMELAVELLATDPIVNDHLGDVYWKVGREYEAGFQWRRALSFDPDPIDADRIRRKLEFGLDVVLGEESEGIND